MPSKDEDRPQSADELTWHTGAVSLRLSSATLAGTIRRTATGGGWSFGGFDGLVAAVTRTETGCVADARTATGLQVRVRIEVRSDGVGFSVEADPAAALADPVCWPPALFPIEGQATELALPLRTTQGIVHHPDPVHPVSLHLEVNGSNGASLSMPFWSLATSTEGVLAVLETPDDAALDIASGPDRGVAVAVAWIGSLGRFGSARAIRFVLTEPGYVVAARRYRSHVIDSGRFVSLADKIAARPAVGGLVGAPYFHTGYLPFAERKLHQVLAGLRDLGYDSGLIGPVDFLQWGAGPWLNDYQPFISEPGYAEVITAAGFVPFAWFYLEDILVTDPMFDPAMLAVDATGGLSTGWQNRDYVYRRVCDATISARGGALRERAAVYPGLHFDTTTAKELTECWSPQHPMTRGDDRRARHDWLAEVASWGHVVGSESGADWAFDTLDFCSNNPRRGLETGFPGPAVHVPLQGIVYHDSVISYCWEYDPYNPSYWGGDWSEAKLAYDLMCGNPPTVSPILGYFPVIGAEPGPVSSTWVMWEDPTTQRLLRAARPAADLHARTAHEAIIDHAYLDEAATVSRTVYSSGTEVVVNGGGGTHRDGGATVGPCAWALDGVAQGELCGARSGRS